MDENKRPDLAASVAEWEQMLKKAEDAHEWAVWQLGALRQIVAAVRTARAAEATGTTTATPPPKEDP